jgi:hypothetical protein
MCIVILVIILVLAILSQNNKAKFESVNKVKYEQSRPNCPQLNKMETCMKMPGCFFTDFGCINNLRVLQEPRKPWEKDDFMIVY